MTFGQGQEMTLTFNTHNTSLAQDVEIVEDGRTPAYPISSPVSLWLR